MQHRLNWISYLSTVCMMKRLMIGIEVMSHAGLNFQKLFRPIFVQWYSEMYHELKIQCSSSNVTDNTALKRPLNFLHIGTVIVIFISVSESLRY